MTILLASGQPVTRKGDIIPVGYNRILSAGIRRPGYDSAALREAREAIRFANTVAPKRLTFTVDYRQTLGQMIAAGRYDWWNDDITSERFVVKGEGVWEFEVKPPRFYPEISTKNVIEEIKAEDTANPWEPFRIEHLLSFGTKHPKEQMITPLIALASDATLFGIPIVAYSDCNDERRGINIHSRDVEWLVFCRLMAFRRIRRIS